MRPILAQNHVKFWQMASVLDGSIGPTAARHTTANFRLFVSVWYWWWPPTPPDRLLCRGQSRVRKSSTFRSNVMAGMGSNRPQRSTMANQTHPRHRQDPLHRSMASAKSAGFTDERYRRRRIDMPVRKGRKTHLFSNDGIMGIIGRGEIAVVPDRPQLTRCN